MVVEERPVLPEGPALAGFLVIGPAGELGLVEAVTPGGEQPGLVVRGGVAGVRRVFVRASDVTAVDGQAREVLLRSMPSEARSWPELRALMGIPAAEWQTRARTAIASASAGRCRR